MVDWLIFIVKDYFVMLKLRLVLIKADVVLVVIGIVVDGMLDGCLDMREGV